MSKDETFKTFCVVQEQNAHGTWEITGHLFEDEAQCRSVINRLTASKICRYQTKAAIVEFARKYGVKAELLMRLDIALTDAECIALLVAIDESEYNGLLHDMADNDQCGGYFSFETVQLYDGYEDEAVRSVVG